MKSPNEKITLFVHEWKAKSWFLLNMFFSILYLFWRIFFTIPIGYGTVSIIAGIALLIVEALGMVEAFVHYANMYSVTDYALPEVPLERFPEVDVFIATYSEDCKLLYKTINGCKFMDYPDPNKVHIYLCDDNRRPEMRALAEQMGVNYLDRPDNKGAKAGNLNNALTHSNSPYVVTFDADMIPKRDFLMKTIPFYVDCEMKNAGRKPQDQIKLGFVQSPQSFYNPDLFQFNLFSEGRIPNEQDYFYKDIQVARTKTNSVIYGGSNTVLSREALNDVGGFYTEAITEDFATGILIQKKGYVSLGIGEPLASGLSATDLPGLVQQRVRWARGVIATSRKMHFFTTKELSFAQKMNYWASMWYWYAPIKRIIYILAPIMYATFGFMVFKCTLPQVLLFWLPMYISSNISLRMLSQNIRTTKWTSIYETVLFPFMLLPVVMESFGITMKKFKVTDKKGAQNSKGKNLVHIIPFLILIVLSIIGIINCIFIMFDSNSFGPIVVLFWLFNNLFLLVMSLFFVDGRIPYRKAERVLVEMESEIDNGIQKMKGITRDISETGVSILLDKPYYLEAEAVVDVSLRSDNYYAELKTQIVFVNQVDKKWNYSMKILDYKNTYNEYLQMIYDRIPVLPTEIKKDSGSFEDLKINTKKRVSAPFFQKRKYPRIALNTTVNYYIMVKNDEKGISDFTFNGKLKLCDFNYCYASFNEVLTANQIIVEIVNGIYFNCCFESKLQNGKILYLVENIDEIITDPQRNEKLVQWLCKMNTIAIQNLDVHNKTSSPKKEQKTTQVVFDENSLV